MVRKLRILSQRGIAQDVSRSSGYEFEDVVASLEEAAFSVPLRPEARFPLYRGRRWLSKRTRHFERMPSGATRMPLEEDVDLFGCFCQKPVELLHIDAIPNWRERSRLAFCVLEELWLPEMDLHLPLIRTLARFDVIACAFASACDPLARLTGRPVIHLPGAADMLRFQPPDPAPERVIDIYCMGRRPPALHEVLRAHFASRGFYLHDSATQAPIVADHSVHRALLASLIQRSRLFMVDIAKRGHADQAHAQIAWGPRHVEGLAGGAVQVGHAPETEDYLGHFDWPEAVARLPEEPQAALAAIRRLLDDPDELDRRRRIGSIHALRRHDWMHRWEGILRVLGLPETEAHQRRRAELERRARALEGRRAVAAE